jgi:hypothetical protein
MLAVGTPRPSRHCPIGLCNSHPGLKFHGGCRLKTLESQLTGTDDVVRHIP